MHDSCNIVAIGANDSAIAQAINTVIERNGGMCVIDGNKVDFLPLPIAGLMTDMDGFELAKRYTAMKANVREMGATVPDPFLSLAFLDLNSLPELKMNEQGLYNVDRMSYTHIFEKV
jgi:adenine deaminase